MIIICVNCNNRSMVIKRWQDAPPVRMQPPRNARNPYARNCFATQIQSLDLQEGRNYTGASLTIPASLAYDIVPLGLGPNDFEITAQNLNDFNLRYWRGLQ